LLIGEGAVGLCRVEEGDAPLEGGADHGDAVLFAGMDTMTKVLTAHYEAPLVVAVRYIVHCLLMIVLLVPTQGRRLV
jgi:hypothetical protein